MFPYGKIFEKIFIILTLLPSVVPSNSTIPRMCDMFDCNYNGTPKECHVTKSRYLPNAELRRSDINTFKRQPLFSFAHPPKILYLAYRIISSTRCHNYMTTMAATPTRTINTATMAVKYLINHDLKVVKRFERRKINEIDLLLDSLLNN